MKKKTAKNAVVPLIVRNEEIFFVVYQILLILMTTIPTMTAYSERRAAVSTIED